MFSPYLAEHMLLQLFRWK